MPYRAMALVAASLLFATQADATKNLNSSRSNIYREAAPKSAAGPATVKGSRMGGGGGGKGAAQLKQAPERPVRSERMGGGGGGKGATARYGGMQFGGANSVQSFKKRK